MRSTKEIQDDLKVVSDKIKELRAEEKKLRDEYDKVSTNLLNLTVGDTVETNMNEIGKVVSVNGPDSCHYIVLIHRIDTGKDDTAMFDDRGLFCGFNRKYTISKLK